MVQSWRLFLLPVIVYLVVIAGNFDPKVQAEQQEHSVQHRSACLLRWRLFFLNRFLYCHSCRRSTTSKRSLSKQGPIGKCCSEHCPYSFTFLKWAVVTPTLVNHRHGSSWGYYTGWPNGSLDCVCCFARHLKLEWPSPGDGCGIR